MNYPRSTQNEIDNYLNAVRKNMQHAPEEEVDEVITHLQEQIDVGLEEAGDTSNESESIGRIITGMSQPESFASPNNKQGKIRQWGILAVLTAVLSWAFNLGGIPYFSFYGLAWFLVIAVSTVLAVVSHKTVLGKVAIAILILEAVSFPILHTMSMAENEESQQGGVGQPATRSESE